MVIRQGDQLAVRRGAARPGERRTAPLDS